MTQANVFLRTSCTFVSVIYYSFAHCNDITNCKTDSDVQTEQHN